MTTKNKEVFKPEVARAIADFIVDKKYVGGMTDDAARACLVTAHITGYGEFSEVGKYAILRDVPNDRIMGAMIRGYDVEKTPEEKVRGYYRGISDFSDKHPRAVVREVLDLLDIKMPGVNA